jgi:glycerophosphoryl diester phosphodiesterase
MKRLKQLAPLLIPMVALAGIIGYVAYRTRRIPIPRRRWKRFDHSSATPLTASAIQSLQGIYTTGEAASFFGKTVVVKSSYTVEKEETIYHLSFFCEKGGKYILFEGKQQGNDIILKGHWRRAAATGKGLAWLVIENGMALLENKDQQQLFQLQGWYGFENNKPTERFSLQYVQPLPEAPPFDVIAHRGGGRNVDFLSISENTTEMVKLAARLGATGIEIDVRMTKDNVPVIFHDSFLSIHTVQGMIFGGMLHHRTLKELKQLELRNLGEIPTLEEMLSTVVYQTPLEIVWLDIKKECDLEQVRKLQQTYQQKAAAIERKVTIYIGVPDKYMLNCFTKLDRYKDVFSLCEMDWDTTCKINAQVWAPQYTGGFQADTMAKVHAAGKKGYVWSLDNKLMIDTYISGGGFDGLVTNTPPVVAHWYYTKGYKIRAKQIASRNVNANL